MTKTKSMTGNQDHDDDDASSMKRSKTCDNGGVAPWSELNHDVLFLVMMNLGIIDFFTFSEVCKSWRSLALCNKKRFMASKPPMYIDISTEFNEKEYCLVDFEGRKFRTRIPYSVDRTFISLTCGYLVLWGKKTRDFWLVNPITRHQLHFMGFPCLVNVDKVKAIIVYSTSIHGWLLVVIDRFGHRIWFSTADTGTWYNVSFTFSIIDLIAFNGKIYTIDTSCHVYEMRLNSKLKLTLLDIKSFPKRYPLIPVFVSLGEKLYVVDSSLKDPFDVFELDFGEMKWVSPKESVIQKYFYFILVWKYEMGVPDRFLNVELINE